MTGTAKADLQTLLRHDHDRLDKLFEDLVAAFRADARDEAAQLWTAFDAGLLAHFDLEEKQILPEFAKVYPVQAPSSMSSASAWTCILRGLTPSLVSSRRSRSTRNAKTR